MSLSQLQSNFLIKMHPVLTFTGSFRGSITIRRISKTESLLRNRRQQKQIEEKSRPFAPKHLVRNELTAKAVHWKEKEGHKLLQKALAKHVAHPPGKIDNSSNRFRIVPEMIPEFIVPDLTDFKLKPYISYRSEPVKQEKITARKLFNLCYGDKIKEIKEQKARSQEQKTQTEDPKVK